MPLVRTYLTWYGVELASHEFRWRTTMPERASGCLLLRQEKAPTALAKGRKADHARITQFVVEFDQRVINWSDDVCEGCHFTLFDGC